ncbi:DUF4097 domain-containing protein [Streptomyces sp. NPDC059524]|uniref:DUF4097 family beta strand repeat-containing protein n=1 Tax=Streptomyces sp. NPDC059524 TaxID=3346856 RepID=UPI0036904F4C
MPSFDTPEPISVTAHVGAGSIRLTASDRADTVVEVRPASPKRDKDIKAAEQTEVAYAGGVLTVRTRERRFIGPSGAVDVTVELPAGSRVDVTGSWTQVLGDGRLGEVHVKTSGGNIRLEETGPLQVSAAHGAIHVTRVEGAAELSTSSGNVRVGVIDGSAVLKNSHGNITVGTVTGELRASGAHGEVDITRAEDSVTATTAYGSLRLGEVASGVVQLDTGYGSIDVGVREGTAAWLDVISAHGQVHNTLADAAPPAETEGTVKIHARTRAGNIEVRRARP